MVTVIRVKRMIKIENEMHVILTADVREQTNHNHFKSPNIVCYVFVLKPMWQNTF